MTGGTATAAPDMARTRRLLPAADDDTMDWQTDGLDWPHREASRFISAAGLEWHVQEMGAGPTVVLVHGTGASTHSWRGLAPLLARRFRVVAFDLPGHGFTSTPRFRDLSLDAMARSVAALFGEIGLKPELAIGHSAGAALLCRMAIDGAIGPRGIVSLNGAFLPFHGMARHLFPPLARVLVWNPLVPRLLTWGAADRASVERLITGTGSHLDAEGIELYRRLFRDPGHVAAAMAMMANWNLEPLEHDLHRLRAALLLVVGENDKAIPPTDATQVRRLVPNGEIVRMPGLGHLAHEERPDLIDRLVEAFAARLGVDT